MLESYAVWSRVSQSRYEEQTSRPVAMYVRIIYTYLIPWAQ